MGKLRASVGWPEMMPEIGHSLPRLGFEMGASPDGDRLPMIFSDFEVNPGQSMGLLNGPIFAS